MKRKLAAMVLALLFSAFLFCIPASAASQLDWTGVMLRHVKESYAGYLKTLIDLEPERFWEILETTGKEQQSRLKYRRLIDDYNYRKARGTSSDWVDFDEL